MNRLQDFKNKGKDQVEMRRRRNEVTVELRKNKREKVISKMRNVPNNNSSSDEDDQPPSTVEWKKLVEASAVSARPEEQLDVLRYVRLISSERNPPLNDLIQSGMLPILVRCLKQHGPTKLQFEAAWILANIAAGSSDQTHQVVSVLLQLLSSPALDVCDKAVWALCNIIDDGPELRDYMTKQGVVQPLLSFVKPGVPISLLRVVVWAIANLCRDKERPLPAAIIHDILPALNMLMNHTDTTILMDTMRTITFLTYGGIDQIQMIIESTGVPKLIPLMGHAEVGLQTAALNAVGNEQAQVVVNFDALSYFSALLLHPKGKIRREAIWFLSNITAVNPPQVQAVIDMGLVPKIIQNLQKGEFRTQKEAACAIRNLTINGNRHQIFALIKKGAIPPFCDLLSCQDAQTLLVVLEGLNNMLKVTDSQTLDVANHIELCGGLDKIEKLQTHKNEQIYKLAYDMIEKYFFDEEEDVNMAPTFDGTQYQFDPNSDQPMDTFDF